jgi:hypothetical protein
MGSSVDTVGAGILDRMGWDRFQGFWVSVGVGCNISTVTLQAGMEDD